MGSCSLGVIDGGMVARYGGWVVVDGGHESPRMVGGVS